MTQKGGALIASGHFPPLTLAQLTNDIASSCGSIDTCTMTNPLHSRQAAIAGIERFMISILESVPNGEIPTLSSDRVMRQFTPQQVRSFTSIVLVFSYVHNLLTSNQTSTTREIYYFHRVPVKTNAMPLFSMLQACLVFLVPAWGSTHLPKVRMIYADIVLRESNLTRRVLYQYYCTTRLVLWIYRDYSKWKHYRCDHSVIRSRIIDYSRMDRHIGLARIRRLPCLLVADPLLPFL